MMETVWVSAETVVFELHVSRLCSNLGFAHLEPHILQGKHDFD